MVGDSGKIYYTTDAGDNWSPQTSNTTATLYSVSCCTGLYCWAVGENGVLVSTTDGGSTWSAQTLVAGATLDDVSFVNAQTGWVVGWMNATSAPVVMKTTDGGSSWTPQSGNIEAAGLTTSARGVHFLSTSLGYIVGSDKLYRTTDGGNTFIQSYIGDVQEDIYAVNGTYLWAAGDWGSVDRSTNGGRQWTSVAPAGLEAWQNSIWAMPVITPTPAAAWVVGEDGVIRHTTDGGASWTDQITPAAGALNDIILVANPTPTPTPTISCPLNSFPYDQGFEDVTFPPSCWGQNTGWSRKTTNYRSGVACAGATIDVTLANADLRRLWVNVDFSGNACTGISFYYRISSVGTEGYDYKVRLRGSIDSADGTDTSGNWSTLKDWTDYRTTTTYAQLTADQNLGIFTNQSNCYIKIQAYSTGISKTLYVDDFQITASPPTPTPTPTP